MTDDYEEQTDGQSDSQSQSILGNMGVALVILGMVVILVILVSFCVKACKTGSKVYSVLLKIRAKILWNMVLRYILQSYLKISIATMFALSLLSVSSDLKAVNCGLTILILLTLFFLPTFFAILLHRNRDKLHTEGMKAKIGSIYLGIRT